jgi:hypothetical protein
LFSHRFQSRIFNGLSARGLARDAREQPCYQPQDQAYSEVNGKGRYYRESAADKREEFPYPSSRHSPKNPVGDKEWCVDHHQSEQE